MLNLKNDTIRIDNKLAAMISGLALSVFGAPAVAAIPSLFEGTNIGISVAQEDYGEAGLRLILSGVGTVGEVKYLIKQGKNGARITSEIIENADEVVKVGLDDVIGPARKAQQYIINSFENGDVILDTNMQKRQLWRDENG